MHLKENKMYRDLREQYWWPSLKREKWKRVAMDFISELPLTPTKKDSVWVIVDRLTMSAHFLPVRTNYSLQKLIVRLYGVLVSIISNRDPRFTSQFWKKLHEALGTWLNFSIAFHLQPGGQSEQVIQILEDMLMCCVINFSGSWEEYFPLSEFAYNNNFQSSIHMAPYEALYGRKYRTPLCWTKLGTTSDRQKSYANLRRKNIEFSVEDQVLLKLSLRFIGPYKIPNRVGPVAYQLELPLELDHIHNVDVRPNLSYEEEHDQIPPIKVI
ncbi:DNA/RNA polymerases superfamily protein [Gossypium australe]|uniref:DNA/RNA polymerases superfamily protein n=1 Tax=Gossypium australe TaxID=47621 RepID=A0A5B6X1A8_9ROSI|nr:DNA/RNA polymerases superfamily protein [Gossypium australe]